MANPADPVTEPRGRTRRTWDLGKILTLVAVLIGAAVLLIAIEDEPYHIDELRQVRSYDRPFGDVVEASFAQVQPPLDPLVNAAVQRVVGVGDARQRLVSVLAGIGSLALLGTLAWRADLRIGSAVAVLTMAISPLLVSVTAYARPYALPLFLSLAFLLAADVWLTARNGWMVPALFIVGLLLPLSRTSEPPLFLGAVIGILAIGWWLRRNDPWRGSPAVPIGAAATGLVVVALPVLWRLSSELAEYGETGSITVFDQLSRLWNEVPGVAAEVLPAWPFLLAVVLIWLALPRARRALLAEWWFWVLVAVPIGFAVVFVLRTPVTQPYYDRYTFSWVPAIALIVGAVTWAIVGRARHGERFVPALVGVLIIATIGSSSMRLAHDLMTVDREDWEAASYLLVDETRDGTVVVFDVVRPFGSYRTPFAGQPRYTGTGQTIPLSVDLARDPSLVPDGSPVHIMLLDNRPADQRWPPLPEVDGWTSLPVDGWFVMYRPAEPPIGPVAAAKALLHFAAPLGPDHGAALTIAAAALLDHAGARDAAAESLDALLSAANSELRDRIETQLADIERPVPPGS